MCGELESSTAFAALAPAFPAGRRTGQVPSPRTGAFAQDAPQVAVVGHPGASTSSKSNKDIQNHTRKG